MSNDEFHEWIDLIRGEGSVYNHNSHNSTVGTVSIGAWCLLASELKILDEIKRNPKKSNEQTNRESNRTSALAKPGQPAPSAPSSSAPDTMADACG